MKSQHRLIAFLFLATSSPLFASDSSVQADAEAEAEVGAETGVIGKTWNNIKETLGVNDEATDNAEPRPNTQTESDTELQIEQRQNKTESQLQHEQKIDQQYQDKAREAMKDGKETVGESLDQETEINAGAEAEAGATLE